jgi:hypothetical protein
MSGAHLSHESKLVVSLRRFILGLWFSLVILLPSPLVWSRMGSSEAVTEATSAPLDAPRVGRAGITRPAPPVGFNRVELGWIAFSYPPDVRDRIQKLIDVADTARLSFTEHLGHTALQGVEVRVARSPSEMSALAPEGAPYPKYASGVAYPDLDLILLTLSPVNPNDRLDLVETFRHELSHIALHDAVKGRPVPRWLNEGLAVFSSGETSMTRLQTLWTATLAGNLIPLSQLERRFPDSAVDASIAYAEAADVVRYLVRTQDRYRFDALIERMSEGQTFEKALELSYGTTQSELESEWRQDVARRYTFWPVLTSSGLLWGVMVGVFFLGYRRRKKRARAVLERWRREEELEDALAERVAQAAPSVPRVHIVLGGSPGSRIITPVVPMRPPQSDVPTVEHDGRTHTLH